MQYSFKFLQTGGVPLTNDLMALIEKSYGIFESLADLAGNLTIIAGCAVNGATVEAGIVAIEGNLYYFEGGQIGNEVFIFTENIYKTFQDQTDKILIEKKTVKFGLGTPQYYWADFIRLKTIKELQELVLASATQQQVTDLSAEIALLKLKTAPIENEMIVFPFRKPANEIPAGWKECLDFQGKTIIGINGTDPDFSTLGSSGGSKVKKILKTNLPAEGLKLYPTKSTSDSWRTASGSGRPVMNVLGYPYSNQYEFSEERTTANLGDGTDFNVMNPYRIVLFIEPNFQ